MNILAVESSCDETAVAIVRDGREVLCDCIASQVELHRIYGGVVPEIASRKHIEAIYGLADQALKNTGLTRSDIDAVAVTYAPGLIASPLHFWMPQPISSRLREAFKTWGKQMHGFLTAEATVIGVETRTSSPVRILRDQLTLQHIRISGLYPCGEGAGYAGGIVSSALDGINCAAKI